MAASLSRTCALKWRYSVALCHRCIGKNERALHKSAVQCKSKPPDVCLSPDKSMIMCWHPEPDFPYEHTQPIPRDKTEMEQGTSVLKVQYLKDEKLKNRPEGPTVSELTQLFHTTKEEFKPSARHEKKVEMKKYKPKDREGL